MKTTVLLTLLISSTLLFQSAHAQDSGKEKSSSKPGMGLKFGANFANVTNASNINAANRTGFLVGAFISPGFSGKTVLGYRSEIVFSRQGYDFKTNTKSGAVMLDYILLPQMTTINITRFVQLQAGLQLAYLLNAKADSTGTNGSKNPYSAVSDYYNKFEYGFTGGVEIHPAKGLLAGARYNLGLSNIYKQPTTTMPVYPAFIPPANDLKSKNNVVQVFVGYKF